MSTRHIASLPTAPDPATAPPEHRPGAQVESFRAICPAAGPVIACGVLLIGIKLSLTLLGFARTRRLVEAHTRRPPAFPPVPMGRVAELERVVALAAAFYPGRALCLEQSLALHTLLRREGVVSRLRLGVQPHPFAAHAWVEVEGAPVNDVVEHVRHFTAFPDAFP